MIQQISSWILTRTHGMSHDTEELSVLELVAKVGAKINELVTAVNGYETTMTTQDNLRVTISDLESKRKLSSVGDFTGTLAGKTLASVFTDVNNSLSLVNTLIGMVNTRESIGTIYDGGLFSVTEPPTITIEGGLY
jgi:hypothetical protein